MLSKVYPLNTEMHLSYILCYWIKVLDYVFLNLSGVWIVRSNSGTTSARPLTTRPLTTRPLTTRPQQLVPYYSKETTGPLIL